MVLVVLGVLVAVTANVAVCGLLVRAGDRGEWSRGGPVTLPSTGPTEEPTEGPTEEPSESPGASTFEYVALGDSFTAAPGVPRPVGERSCGRSTNNYPHLVARALPRTELVDRSCNGADTRHLTTNQYPSVEPQLDALGADTDLVTLSLGGNDFGLFAALLSACPTLRDSDPTGAPCSEVTGAYSARNLRKLIEQTGDRLQTALELIKARSPRAEVMLVGYPVLAPANGTCTDRLPLADGDFAYVNSLGSLLNTAMKRAATNADATYVDIYGASQGHDICSADPWVNDRTTDPGRALFYHPFAEEQAAVARLILAEID
jgi:lysophospholipase L1-like esterase